MTLPKKVIKRDGRVVDFDSSRIENAIKKAMIATNSYTEEKLKQVLSHVLKVIEERFGEKEIPHVEQIQDIVELSLMKFDLYETAKAYVLYRKERERIREEKKKILEKDKIDEVDKRFSLNSLRLLASRYLLRDENGKLIESPKQMFQRVAMLIVIPDILYDQEIFDKDGNQKVWPKEEFNWEEWDRKIGLGKKEDGSYEVYWNKWHLERMKDLYDRLNGEGKMKVSWNTFFEMLKQGKFEKYYQRFLEYYNLMVNKQFSPNSPTYFNAGTRLGQLSACFVLDIEDDMESIMETAKEAAIISKTGGGVGINYSKLRPEGDIVASTSGVASGPVSFMRIIDVVTDVIKQGGCISSNSYLFTNLGILTPENLPIINPRNEYILPFNIYDGNSYTSAIFGGFGNLQELFVFKTKEGYELKVTYNELVAVLNKNFEIEFKKAFEISKNDWLVLVLGEHKGKKIKLEPINHQHFNANKLKIPNYLNEDLAEILGIYMADGCFNNGRLIISFSSEKPLNYFKEKIEKTLGLKVGEIRDKKSWKDVVWYSKDLEKYFEKRKWKKMDSSNAFIPLDVLNSEKKVLAAFLKGLFEGDGYVRKDGYIIFSTTSERLAKDIQIALLSLGILSHLEKINANKIPNHFGKKNIYRVEIIDKESIKKFLKEVGFLNKEKIERVKKALNKKFEFSRKIPHSQKILRKIYETLKKKDKKLARKFYRKTHKYMLGYRNLTYNALKRLEKEFPILKKAFSKYKNFIFLKVEKIERKKEKVFHLETLSGRYVVNGFLVHNRRRGANMGVLEVWHPDIEKFISAKSEEGVLTNFNISVMLTPEFWKAYEEGKEFPLINPRNGKIVKKVDPKALLNLIAFYAWKTADPGVLFFDHINRRNILINARGPIRATNPCVTGDTLIPTEFGLISMKELVEKYPNGGIKIAVDNRVPLEIKFSNGSKILIQKSQKGISFYEITKAFSNGIKDVYKIETESGLEIKVTKEHKFYTKNGWKGIDELIPGIDSIYIQSGEIPFNRNKKLPFDVKNEFRGKNGRLYKFNFSKEWSKELGEVLGYLIGDGWLSDDKNYRVGLTFSEKTLLNYFKSILDKWYGKKIKFVKRENGVYHLSYHSKFFVDFFKKLGVKSVKAEEKEVPKTIFTATKEAVIGFLRGLFTADGTIQIDKNKGNYYIRLTSKSKKLLKQVQILLLSLGIKSKIYNRSRSPQVKFEYKTKDGKKKEYFVDGKLFELHISKENIPKFIQKIGFLESTKNKKVELLKDRSYHSEIFEDKVKKIEYVGKEEVFDLTEPLSKSFITNGLISLDCGEQPLHPYGSCNLGSINLYAFIKRENGKAEFDWEKLKDVVKKAVRFLDNVIDVNKFPLKKIERVSRESRNIGLGIMGLADTLFALQIPYNSEEGFEFMRKVIEFIAYHAFLESIELSKERGPFPIFEKSEYPKGEMPLEGFYRKEYWTQDWPKIPELIKQFGIRNSNIMSIAPTGSISMIMDTSSGLEPQFALTFEKSVTVGKFYYVDPEFEFQLKQRGLYREDILKKIADNGGSVQGLEEIPEDLKKVFVVAYDIPWWDHVRAQYEIGLWVDAGISKTINMPNWVTVEDVLNAYIFAYKLGLKGITIYRDGSKSVQVLITPSQRKGKYIRIVKNKTLELMKQFGIDISKYLEEINKSNNNSTFQTIIKPKLPLLTSPQQIDNQIKGEEKVEKVEGKVCPVCGSNRLIYREGCITCLDCGWSECTVG